MNKYLVASLLITGLGLTSFAFAQITNSQISACVSKNGETRLIVSGFTKKQACEKGEMMISLPMGSASAKFHIYDSNNTDLGELVDIDVPRNANGGDSTSYLGYSENINAYVRYFSNIAGSTVENLRYEGPDCTGRVIAPIGMVLEKYLYVSDNTYLLVDPSQSSLFEAMSSKDQGHCTAQGAGVEEGWVVLKEVQFVSPAFPLHVR